MSERVLTFGPAQVDARNSAGRSTILTDVELALHQNEIVALVGESGSGKTTFGNALMGILPSNFELSCGSYEVCGKTIDTSEPYRMDVNQHFGMVFQDPYLCLDPSMTIGRQVIEALLVHETADPREVIESVSEALTSSGLPEPGRLMKRYPHQLSGGMCQRVAIAMALIKEPQVIIADEPTANLDVTIGAQILELIQKSVYARKISMILITHNFSIAQRYSDFTMVMYGGQVVEKALTPHVFHNAFHPYTLALLDCHEILHLRKDEDEFDIRSFGLPPESTISTPGCVFHERCGYRRTRCESVRPTLRDISRGHLVACHFVEEIHASLKSEGSV